MPALHHFAGTKQIRYATQEHIGILALDDARLFGERLNLSVPDDAKYLLVAGRFPDAGPRVEVDATLPLTEKDLDTMLMIMKYLPAGQEFSYEAKHGKVHIYGGDELTMRLYGSRETSLTFDRNNAQGLIENFSPEGK